MIDAASGTRGPSINIGATDYRPVSGLNVVSKSCDMKYPAMSYEGSDIAG
jgi:hypothetical protein